MKLKIEINSKIFSEEEAIIHIDKALTNLLKEKPFKFQRNCIKRTDTPNIVEIGDFATCDSERLTNSELYAKTILNLTFGKNYTISVAT